jgi:sporulation-control protein spo0M
MAEGVSAMTVFKRLLGSMGVGGPAADSVLDPAGATPGGSLTGKVRLTGGRTDFDIEHITLELVARVEAETEHGEHDGTVAFERFTLGGGFRLHEGETAACPPRSLCRGRPRSPSCTDSRWASCSGCGPSSEWRVPGARAISMP